MSTPKNADIGEQREDDVVRMRTRDRMSFREIAAALGCDVKNVHTAWKRAREKSNRDAAEALDAWRGEQLATLDLVIDGLMPRALAGDARAGQTIVQAIERTAKTLGTDAPTRANTTVTVEQIERVKALVEEISEA